MTGFSFAGKLCAALACTGAVLALGSSAAAAVEPRLTVGRLPGFPHQRGVIPVLDSPAALSAHERLVKQAFSALRAERDAVEPSSERLSCPVEFAFTQNVCYLGGPVLRKPVVHLIFWLGPNTAGLPTTLQVKRFPLAYQATIERYFADLAHDSGATTDVYAVDPQYSDGTGPGVNGVVFVAASDSALDSESFPGPKPECSDPTPSSEGPCLQNIEIQKEVTRVATERGWSTGLGNIFFVFTPPGVGSCAEFGCAYQAYCAYHSDFGGDGVTPGPQTVYANIPFAAPGVCDHGFHPNETTDSGTDAAIDNASHEFNEAITDPLGSQCKTKTECEPSSWTDAIGQEIGDKCLPPETTIAGQYGEPLVQGLEAGSYNQLINGHPYWTQTEWSNEAGVGEGRCVQRFLNTKFSVSSGARATAPTGFDASASGEVGDPITYWVWDFGDKMQVGTPDATVSHTYASANSYHVTLTAYDAYGNSNTGTLTVEVAPPSPSPSPSLSQSLSPSPSPGQTVTIATPPAPIVGYEAVQIARKLGLPANGKTLPGRGSISLGVAECPPACRVILTIYATVRRTSHHRAKAKRVVVGALTVRLLAGASGALLPALNATGRKLLAKSRKLSVQLIATVIGQEGGTWQISRSLILTSSGRATRH